MKIFKKYEVSFAFWTIFNKIASFGGPAPRTPYKRILLHFSKIFAKNSRHFFKISLKL